MLPFTLKDLSFARTTRGKCMTHHNDHVRVRCLHSGRGGRIFISGKVLRIHHCDDRVQLQVVLRLALQLANLEREGSWECRTRALDDDAIRPEFLCVNPESNFNSRSELRVAATNRESPAAPFSSAPREHSTWTSSMIYKAARAHNIMGLHAAIQDLADGRQARLFRKLAVDCPSRPALVTSIEDRKRGDRHLRDPQIHF